MAYTMKISFATLALFGMLVGTLPTTAAEPSATAAEKATKTKLKIARGETAIYVGDMHCAGCAKKIARKLYAVKGVVKVRTDLKADVAVVTPQKKKKLDPDALWLAAEAAGFPAVKLVGPSGTFIPDPETKAAKKLSEAELKASQES